jgi:hypothetical protein
MSITSPFRLVAVFDDPHAARSAVDLLAGSLSRDQISIQAGDDRAWAEATRIGDAPAPTRLAEGRSRVPFAIGVTLLGAVIGAIIGGLVFLPFEVDVLPRWGEIAIFAVIGAIAGGAYSFVMSGGSGPRPGRETDEGTPQIITVSVPFDRGSEGGLRQALSESGAVRVETAPATSADGRAHH